MEFRQVDEHLAVSGQISAADLAQVAAAGFRSIVCNRPDGEAPDQPGFAEIAAAAQALGLPSRHIPVTGGNMQRSDAVAFADAMEELPKPVLAYCRSGARSGTLYAMAKQVRG